MSWNYEQASGKLQQIGTTLQFLGYSGAGAGKNNPDKQDVKNVGPVPKGVYTINAPVDTKTHGPFVLPLVPHPDNAMFGRSGFLIHGDSVVNPGTASEGCIIVNRPAREVIWQSKDRVLIVT